MKNTFYFSWIVTFLLSLTGCTNPFNAIAQNYSYNERINAIYKTNHSLVMFGTHYTYLYNTDTTLMLELLGHAKTMGITRDNFLMSVKINPKDNSKATLWFRVTLSAVDAEQKAFALAHHMAYVKDNHTYSTTHEMYGYRYSASNHSKHLRQPLDIYTTWGEKSQKHVLTDTFQTSRDFEFVEF